MPGVSGEDAVSVRIKTKPTIQTSLMEPCLQKVAVVHYEGERASNGLYQGQGRAVFVTGGEYTGMFSMGLMHGSGSYTWPDGVEYRGEFDRNTLTGTGTYTWPGAKYIGGVLNGLRHGNGKMSFSDSPVAYEGDWKNGMRHGKGKLVFDDAGIIFYDGDWDCDAKHGRGKMTYPGGGMYEGGWERDQRNGRGVMNWGQREQYSGLWLNNLQHGLGEHIWFLPSGEGRLPGTTSNRGFYLQYNRYEGEFSKGKREGWGVLHYATSARYEGQWHEDSKQGQGVFVFEDGTVFRGDFQADKPVLGEGEFLSPGSPGVSLHTDDLLAEEQNPQATMAAVSNHLLCYNTELRHIYEQYSRRKIPLSKFLTSNRSFAMIAQQFWELARDCGVLSPGLPLARINAALHQATQPPEEVKELREACAQEQPALKLGGSQVVMHDPRRPLLFREFAEALVRIAHLRHHALPSLELRVHRFITNDLLPRVGSKAPETARFPLLQDPGLAEALLRVIENRGMPLQRRFLQAATGSSTALAIQEMSEESIYGATATIRASLVLLSSLGVFKRSAEGLGLTREKAGASFMQACSMAAERPDGQPLVELDVPVIVSEFVVGLVLCSMQASTPEGLSLQERLSYFLEGPEGVLQF